MAYGSKLELHFSTGSVPQLDATNFLFPAFGCEQRAIRGKPAATFGYKYTFQWSPGVRALGYLLVKTKAAANSSAESSRFVLEGAAHSLAASLDYSIAKSPQWLLDMFGVDSHGTPIARRLFERYNPERKRPGPVKILLNESRLPISCLDIYVGEEQIHSFAALTNLAGALEAQCRIPACAQSLEQEDTQSLSISCHGQNSTSASSELADAKSERAFSVTEELLSSNATSLLFRNEWLAIVNQVAQESRESLYGMVFDTEVPKWWQSIIGRLYLRTNMQLLRRKIKIKRLYLLTTEDPKIREQTLLSAVVNEMLGVDVGICEESEFYENAPLKGGMFSIHDGQFAALHMLKCSPAFTNIVQTKRHVIEYTNFYEDFFANKDVCKSPTYMLASCANNSEVRRKIENEFRAMGQLLKSPT